MIHFLVHEKTDSVGVATTDISAGSTASGLYMDNQESVEIAVQQDIPLGHKLALKPHQIEDHVIKYGHNIGKVVKSFAAGAHVHTHNLKTGRW